MIVSRSDHTPGAQAPAAGWRADADSAGRAGRAATDESCSVARSALAFAALRHAGQRRGSDGAPFIEHPVEVARLLRDAGCSDVVVAAGVLHHVVQDADVTVAELTALFGTDVANLVQAASDDASIQSYRERKQMLRERVRDAGGDAALLFAADNIAKVRELPDQARRDRARFDATGRGARARDRVARYHQLRLEHYNKSLAMLRCVAPRHPLVGRLAHELDNCPSPSTVA